LQNAIAKSGHPTFNTLIQTTITAVVGIFVITCSDLGSWFCSDDCGTGCVDEMPDPNVA
jgi:hypothetical protein